VSAPDHLATETIDISSTLENRPYEAVIAVDIPYTRDEVVTLEIRRLGTVDDSTGIIYLLGVQLDFESDGPNNGLTGPYATTPPFII
jgi:hypothetical protein